MFSDSLYLPTQAVHVAFTKDLHDGVQLSVK